MSERDSSEFETSEFVHYGGACEQKDKERILTGLSPPKQIQGQDFKQIQFQPQNKSRFRGRLVFYCTMWKTKKKTVTENLSLGKQL